MKRTTVRERVNPCPECGVERCDILPAYGNCQTCLQKRLKFLDEHASEDQHRNARFSLKYHRWTIGDNGKLEVPLPTPSTSYHFTPPAEWNVFDLFSDEQRAKTFPAEHPRIERYRKGKRAAQGSR